METLRQWILTIAATALACGIARALTPEGPAKRAVAFICGLAMTAALVSIAPGIDLSAVSVYTARYGREADIYVEEAQEAASAQTRFIIESRCEAYILDKAGKLGVSIDGVSVTARWNGEFWYPERAEVMGAENRELSRALEAELGITRENQIWSTDDEG